MSMLEPSAIRREVAISLGLEAERIMADGRYRSRSGRIVSIEGPLRRSVRETVYYGPESDIASTSLRSFETTVNVVDEVPLSAGRRLLEGEMNPVVINSGSGLLAGGGYEAGARTQEASLARASGLAACLKSVPEFYEHHRRYRNSLYSDAMIYTRDVPFFRDVDHSLMDDPVYLSVITAVPPSVRYDQSQASVILSALRRRASRIFSIAQEHGHDAVVIGPWGCASGENDPALVAEIIAEELESQWLGTFREIVFAIRDRSDDRRLITPFEKTFATVCQ